MKDTEMAEPAEDPSGPSYLSASSILVIHPGSRYLRIGRASDPQPKQMLHCLARRRKPTAQGDPYRDDGFLVSRVANLDGQKYQKVEESRQRVSQILRKSLQSDGTNRYAVPSKHVSDLNVKVKVKKTPRQEPWHEPEDEVLIGEEVLNLSPDSNYNIHFPYRRGDINLHEGIGGSQTSILLDLETIWTHAVENLLGIPKANLESYRAVLIIPAMFKRKLLKHYMTLLLVNMGFGGAFLIQDHVASTFGAGQGYACVVDIGDQKTSISCVEDCYSHPETRIHLDYGGSDITQVFHYLVRKVAFPVKPFQPEINNVQAELISKLKEENCHLDLDFCGMTQKQCDQCLPGDSHIEHYSIYFGDDLLIAPCALFHTDMFELTARDNTLKTMEPNTGDYEDPHDQIYLAETSRKYTRAAGNTGDTTEASESQPMDDELEIVNDDEGSGSRSNSKDNTNALISLDQAIIKSIESCPNEDLKKKMYSCIVLVGGSCRFRSLEKFLHSKLSLQIPLQYRSDPTEVIKDAKSNSSSMTCWKGAAVMSCLEPAQELWIKPPEWKKHGQKILREKSAFPLN